MLLLLLPLVLPAVTVVVLPPLVPLGETVASPAPIALLLLLLLPLVPQPVLLLLLLLLLLLTIAGLV